MPFKKGESLACRDRKVREDLTKANIVKEVDMSFKCEYCNGEEETKIDLEIKHRACRLKAAFPGAYTERGDGLVTFDMKKVVETLGLFDDWIIDTNGKHVQPLEGGLHFRIGAYWSEPEVWIEVPIEVANSISSWSFRITEKNWQKIVQMVGAGIEAARKHIALQNGD